MDTTRKRKTDRPSRLPWNAVPDEGFILITEKATQKLCKGLAPLAITGVPVCSDGEGWKHPVAVWLDRNDAEDARRQLGPAYHKIFRVRKVLLEILPE